MPLKFFNREKKTVRGKVKLTPGGIGGDALAIVPIKIPAQSEWATAVTLAPEKARKLAGADYKVDDDYHCWPFINNQGVEVDHFYTRIYNGSQVTGTDEVARL